MRRAGRLLVAIVLLVLAACGGGSSSDAQSSGKKTDETTVPTGLSAKDPGCRFIVAGTAKRATNAGSTLEYLTVPTAKPFACYDRVSFTFSAADDKTPTTTAAADTGSSTCAPGYTVEYRKAPFGLLKPDMKPVSTSTAGFKDAKAVLYVEMAPAIALSTYPAHPDLAYPGGLRLVFQSSTMHHIRIVEWVKTLPEGESTSAPTTTLPGVAPAPQRVVWLIGMDRKRPFTTDCAIGAPPDEICPLTACTHINVLIMR